MSYPALLALHLIAVILFVGGLALAAATLPRLRSVGEARRLRRLGLFVTTPALLLVWLFGIALAVEGGWYHEGWLWAKLALVLLLSALHGWLSARLRRADDGRTFSYRPLLLLAAAVIGIIALVTNKPF